ncbi:MAG: hypothetical protein QF864_00720, partial [SAR202 cluster bacterium]|nr:hypothetical protein [SAR202 cluster bacterium]
KLNCKYTFFTDLKERKKFCWLTGGQKVIQIWSKTPLHFEQVETTKEDFSILTKFELKESNSEDMRLPSYLFLEKLRSEGLVSLRISTSPEANNWLTESSVLEKVTMGWYGQYCSNLCQPNWIQLKQLLQEKLCQYTSVGMMEGFMPNILKEYEVQIDLMLYNNIIKQNKTWKFEFIMSGKPENRPKYYSYTELPLDNVRKYYSYVEFVQLCYEFLIQNIAGKEFNKIQITDFLEAQPHFRIDPAFMVLLRIYK